MVAYEKPTKAVDLESFFHKREWKSSFQDCEFSNVHMSTAVMWSYCVPKVGSTNFLTSIYDKMSQTDQISEDINSLECTEAK
jgi:hypothetical protein